MYQHRQTNGARSNMVEQQLNPNNLFFVLLAIRGTESWSWFAERWVDRQSQFVAGKNSEIYMDTVDKQSSDWYIWSEYGQPHMFDLH